MLGYVVMKKLLAIAVLGLILITPSQANNIEDFQIEGMSIGDSLLDYFSKEQIEMAPRYDNTNTNSKSDKFYEVRFENIGNYTEMMFSLKKNDQIFKIYSVQAIEKYANNISECYKKIDKIADEIETLFSDVTRKKNTFSHGADKTKKSKVTEIAFTLKSGDRVTVQCYDWTKEMRYWDNLRVAIINVEFRYWLRDEKYK
jgi:tRNA(Ser,Leu) C12 N-acetylase TAN1